MCRSNSKASLSSGLNTEDCFCNSRSQLHLLTSSSSRYASHTTAHKQGAFRGCDGLRNLHLLSMHVQLTDEGCAGVGGGVHQLSCFRATASFFYNARPHGLVHAEIRAQAGTKLAGGSLHGEILQTLSMCFAVGLVVLLFGNTHQISWCSAHGIRRAPRFSSGDGRSLARLKPCQRACSDRGSCSAAAHCEICST